LFQLETPNDTFLYISFSILTFVQNFFDLIEQSNLQLSAASLIQITVYKRQFLNKTRALLQTTGGKDESNIVCMRKS
jgi:hypothetical protein